MAKDRRREAKPSKSPRQTDKTMSPFRHKPDTLPADDLIGRKLREYYNEVAKEPVPDRFTALLDQLEGKSAAKKTP